MLEKNMLHHYTPGKYILSLQVWETNFYSDLITHTSPQKTNGRPLIINMGSLKLLNPWNGREHKGFVWEFRLNIEEIFHEMHLSTKEDSQLDSTHLSRRLCSVIPAIGHVLFFVDVWFVGSGEGLPSLLHWEVSRPPFERGWVMSVAPTISIGRWPAGKSSIRKVECRMRKLKSAMSKVGCGKQKLKGQMLNVEWKNECTFHWTWRSNSKTWLWLNEKVEYRKQKLECYINESWMLNAKKMNRECKLKWQPQNVG